MKENIMNGVSEDQAEDEIIQAKAYLSSLVTDTITKKGWTQQQTADFLGISQPRISEIVQARLDKISVDYLLVLLFKLGYKADISFTPHKRKKHIQIVLVAK